MTTFQIWFSNSLPIYLLSTGKMVNLKKRNPFSYIPFVWPFFQKKKIHFNLFQSNDLVHKQFWATIIAPTNFTFYRSVHFFVFNPPLHNVQFSAASQTKAVNQINSLIAGALFANNTVFNGTEFGMYIFCKILIIEWVFRVKCHRS